jgi:hypothetical protein
MNLISGVLLTLWLVGWAVASLRAMRLARAEAITGPISRQ